MRVSESYFWEGMGRAGCDLRGAQVGDRDPSRTPGLHPGGGPVSWHFSVSAHICFRCYPTCVTERSVTGELKKSGMVGR